MKPPTVVIAGATGFVGKALCSALSGRYRVVGLTRSARPRTDTDSDNDSCIEWRTCDLFSAQQCENALSGADYAVYLVHSMLPSASLTQGGFEDMDLIIADNFARAAKRAGIKHIVYLSGLVPDDIDLSEHLRSRLEVERTLGSRGVPVTALRAGMVIGPAGSSFNILVRLIDRIPVIPLPRWTKSLTQPIALSDVISLIRHCLENPCEKSRAFDIGCPDIMSYREMLTRTAKLMGARPLFLKFGHSSATWWRYLLAYMVGAPVRLVLPLIESMRHSMVARDLRLQHDAGVPGVAFDEAVREALKIRDEQKGKAPFRRYWECKTGSGARDVRSVQRMALPAGRSALWAANEYTVWLPMFFRTFIRAEVDSLRNLRIGLRFTGITLLQLTYAADRSTQTDRQLFYITGGLLARLDHDASTPRPRLEFREAMNGTVLLAAIHDYRPTLPWFVYNITQALAHIWVMRRFARHLTESAPRK